MKPSISLALGFLSLALVYPLYICADQTLENEYYALAESFKDAKDNDPKNIGKAIEHYENVLRLNPTHFKALTTLAGIYFEQGQIQKAATLYEKASASDPENAQLHYNCGLCLVKSGQADSALTHFELATSLRPDYTKAWLQLAALYQEKKKPDQAVAAYKKAISYDPNLFDAHLALGRIKREQNNFDEAIQCFRAARACDANNTGAMLELANTLNMLDWEKARESLDLYKRALEINPNLIPALYNYGYTLKKLGHISEALEIYNKVIELRPNYGLARFGRSVSYLMLGDFEKGWPEYEWRWAAYDESPKKFDSPVWDGSSLAGKTIIVYAEQGLGDTFQFIRYLKLLKEQGARVIFETQRPLKDILSLCPHIDLLVARGEKVPAADTHIALMSLPMIFKTRIDTVPIEIPYLSAKPELVALWKDRLAADTNFKIGICWQGNSQYSTQFLRQAVAAKSMTAAHFVPIAQIPGVSLYSLQKVNGADQLSALPADAQIRDFGTDFDEKNGRFMDTAAIMKNLDLVVTIDTSICHLAAALGAPTWNLLPTPADWRWLIDTNKTPWYPNMRLFRQQTPGDWNSLIQEVVTEIKKIMPRKSHYSTLTAQQAQPAQQAPIIPAPIRSAAPVNGQFNEFATQINMLDQELSRLELSLFNKSRTTIDEEYATLARKAYYAYNMKQYLLRSLRSASSNAA